MRCPCCEKELIVTHRDRYQDQSEHVSNPNGTPSMKDGYQCLDQYCIANNLGATWIEDGEIYMDPPDGVKTTVAHRVIEKMSVTGMYWALDSWNNSYQGMIRDQKAKTFSVRFFKHKFTFVPKFDTDYDKNPTEYTIKPFSWKIEWWKKDSDMEGCYTSVTPVFRIIKWRIGDFKRGVEKMHSEKDAIDLMTYIAGNEKWGISTKTSNFIGWWIRVFHRSKVTKVREFLDALQRKQMKS